MEGGADGQDAVDQPNTDDDVAEPIFLPSSIVEAISTDDKPGSPVDDPQTSRGEEPLQAVNMADQSSKNIGSNAEENAVAQPIASAVAPGAPLDISANTVTMKTPEGINTPQLQPEIESSATQHHIPVWEASNSYSDQYPELLSTPDPALVSVRDIISRGRKRQGEPASVCRRVFHI